MNPVKVGSLFDGIGGTPLSAVMCGAEPVWASEIEKVPISITERHFPNMVHLGDITEINGAEIDPVDIIVGGSPCQDLSIAGRREGLGGERSGLFMEQIRIVKEMRDAARKGADGLSRPRYMVWENVPGAFSSNKGEDFRAVLEEIARIVEPGVSIPQPDKWGGQGQYWVIVTPLHGESLTLNTGEFPNAESVSTLSQILEVDPHQKYYLSEKACRGILRRAGTRGKPLPPQLEAALKAQAGFAGEPVPKQG